MEQASPSPVLGVSIVTYRIDIAEFTRVLESLCLAVETFVGAGNPGVEIQILDNGDQEDQLTRLADTFQTTHCRFRIIGGLNNIGYGRAHNLAILTSSAPYHLVLNPDVILDPDCLSNGVEYLGRNQGVTAVAPKAYGRDGGVQYLCKNFPSVFDLMLRGFAPLRLKNHFRKRLMRYEMRDATLDEPVLDVPLISGCFMLCRTAMLKKVGGFDERFFLYFEDFALSMELRKHGQLAYLPAMKISHFGGHAARKGLWHVRLFVSSAIKFFNLYGWKLI